QRRPGSRPTSRRRSSQEQPDPLHIPQIVVFSLEPPAPTGLQVKHPMPRSRREEGCMTKSDLIEVVANKLHLPKGKAELIVNCIFDSMEESLKRGERIEIRGFGSFEIRHYKAYEGRNPRTGDPVGVQPKRLPFFKVGKE